MKQLEVMRAEEEWQRAGAYSVRIQGMNRQHHISLRDEFDEHDTKNTNIKTAIIIEYLFMLTSFKTNRHCQAVYFLLLMIYATFR